MASPCLMDQRCLSLTKNGYFSFLTHIKQLLFATFCDAVASGAINRAWERNPYIMYPMKIQNREFFGLNMKFSMCRDYTKIFSKIAPPGKGEK